MQKKQIFLLILAVTLIFLFGCIEQKNEFNCIQGKTFTVSRIIDGDTIEAGKTKIRLKGINTPEKNEACFQEAKDFLKKQVLGKQILVQGNEFDRYGRLLGNICIQGKSINKMLLEQGLAHYYSYENIPELMKLQEKAMKEKKECLWKESKEQYFLDKCISLTGFEFNQNKFTGEFAEFSNDCNYSIDLNGFYLKDEATNQYFFPAIKLKAKSFVRVYSGYGENSKNEFYWKKGNIWNNNRDQLFLRNEKGILVAYYKYTNNLN